MANNMKYIRLYFHFFRINLMKSMAYRGNFFLGMLLVCIESLTTLFTIKIVFNHIGSIAGWSFQDMLVLSGVFMITNSLAWLFYKASIGDLDRLINRGELDMYLVKPVDTQFMISIHNLDIEDGARGIVGLALIAFGMQGSHVTELFRAIPLFLITLILGQVVIYSISLAVKTVSFKSIQGWATNAIAWRFHELARYPTDIYQGILRILYTFIFPLAFIATVPTKALLGTITLPLIVGSFAAAIGTFTACRCIWKWALRSYTSASS